MEQLTRRVFLLPHVPGTNRPTLGYIRGSRRAILVDAGPSPARIRRLLEGIRVRELPRPEMAVLTHRHWDHTFGLSALDIPALARQETAACLERFSAMVWDREGVAEYLALEDGHGFTPEGLQQEFPRRFSIHPRPARVVINSPQRLELGGCRCLLLPVDSPHCEDCLVVLAEEERVLFLGDAASPRQDGADPAAAGALLQTLSALDFHTAVPGHGPPLPRYALLHQLRKLTEN